MKKFKVWNRAGKCWIKENIDDFVEFNWTLPGYGHDGEAYVEINPDIDVEIIWQDDHGDFVSPED